MKLTYSPPQVFIEPSFWEELYSRKIDEFKLDDSYKAISAEVSLLDGWTNFSKESFNLPSDIRNQFTSSSLKNGTLFNFNTMNDFLLCNKQQILDKVGNIVYESIQSGASISRPDKLYTFIMLSFADLKTYRFTYWYADPVVLPETPFESDINPAYLSHSKPLISQYIYQNFLSYLSEESSRNSKQIFMIIPKVLANDNTTDYKLVTLEAGWSLRYHSSASIIVFDAALSSLGQVQNATDNEKHTTSELTSAVFGFSMRNLLALVSYHHTHDSNDTTVNIVSLRGTLLRRVLTLWQNGKQGETAARSLIASLSNQDILTSDCSLHFQLDLRNGRDYWAAYRNATIVPKYVGWDVNERGRPGPRVADLSSSLDTSRLVSQAVDLNVSLMKWRVWPELDTQRVSGTKCLLFGAGTLGCAVARMLLGWGVRNLTFIDNGTVSYSNPSRQCLFEFSDCVSRKHKAVAAADSLKRILPGVNSKGLVVSVPMPGHPLTTVMTSAQNGMENEDVVQTLDELVRAHDVIFALTDSRESRWLPTLLCAAHDKVLINAALGFDSYLVMRHGHGVHFSNLDDDSTDNHRLGCYFCNDVVAAVNSQKDRTLDQQCTVTRPGLSFIAAGLAVELMIALRQSPNGNRHLAPSHLPLLSSVPSSSTTLQQQKQLATSSPVGGYDTNSSTSKNGIDSANEDVPNEADSEKYVQQNNQVPIPHQIRGGVATFTQMDITSACFSCCTGCSARVVNEYRARGSSFIRAVCADGSGKLLQDVSGVTELMSRVNLDDCVEIGQGFGDDDDF